MKIILTMLLVGLLVGCHYPVAKFYKGEIVRSVVNKQIGQVLDVWCDEDDTYCTYTVRFGASSVTQTHILFDDDPVKSNALYSINVQEFEITAP